MTHQYSTSTWAHPPRKTKRYAFVYLLIAGATTLTVASFMAAALSLGG